MQLGTPKRGFMGYKGLGSVNIPDSELEKYLGGSYSTLIGSGWADAGITGAYYSEKNKQPSLLTSITDVFGSVAAGSLQTYIQSKYGAKGYVPTAQPSFLGQYGLYLALGGAGLVGFMLLKRRS